MLSTLEQNSLTHDKTKLALIFPFNASTPHTHLIGARWNVHVSSQKNEINDNNYQKNKIRLSGTYKKTYSMVDT